MWNDAALTLAYGTFTSGGKTPSQLSYSTGVSRDSSDRCCLGVVPPLKLTLTSPFFLPLSGLSSGYLSTDYTRHVGATPGATYRVLVVNGDGQPVYDAGLILNASGASGFGFEGLVNWITTGDITHTGRINLVQLLKDVVLPTPARLVTNLTGANNDLFVQAKPLGILGNLVSLKLTNAGYNQTLLVSVSGVDIDVRLATTSGVVTSTASQVLSALQASSPSNALVSVGLKGSDTGAGVITAMAKTNLVGGQDAPADRVALRSKPLWLVIKSWNGTAVGYNWSPT